MLDVGRLADLYRLVMSLSFLCVIRNTRYFDDVMGISLQLHKSCLVDTLSNFT